MRKITAKFNSTCAETGKPIKKGQSCLYDPTDRKVYSLDSQMAKAEKEHNSHDGQLVQAQEDAYFDNFCQSNGI